MVAIMELCGGGIAGFGARSNVASQSHVGLAIRSSSVWLSLWLLLRVDALAVAAGVLADMYEEEMDQKKVFTT